MSPSAHFSVEDAEAPESLRDHIKAERIKLPRELFGRSRWHILRHGFTPFGFIVGSLALARTTVPVGVALPIHFALLLAAHRGFQTQVHDLSHKLFNKDQKLNDLLGNLLAAGWTGTHVQSYRKVHFQHHAFNGSAQDPEHISYTKIRAGGGLTRFVGRYVLGLHTVRLFRKYYATGEKEATRPAPEQRSLLTSIRQWSQRWPIPVAQGALVTLFWAVGHSPWLYFLWAYQAVSWSPMLSGLRFLVEHPGDDDRTVTTLSNLVERLYFAPFNFNFHFEHHVWPTLPPYRLREAHAYLQQQGYYTRHPATLGQGFARQLLAKANTDQASGVLGHGR